MTFSITGYCDRTKMTGVAITTSSICVASRCPWVRAGVGAVATQNITDPSLGPLILDYLQAGDTAAEAIEKVTRNREFIAYRQLTVVDIQGNTAQYTGDEILGTHAVVTGKHCVAAGNLLSSTSVPQAMADSFNNHADLHLAERLLTALAAGVSAGGEEGPTHSSGLKVAHQHPWPLVDLRIDWSEGEPVSELMQLWKTYEPQVADYTARAIDPTAAPSYGVPGDL
ncbi:MAG: DUF1028 domain-containing protein [Gammaproteobacteria bacterium]|nr:DUF1028 domain-containing protein [Gammaproteobacteria bacterium]